MSKKEEPMQEPAKMACMCYATDAYAKLNALNRKEIQDIADAASELSQQRPLWHYHGKEFTLPHTHGKLSGLHVIAYLAAAVDILSGHQITDNRMSTFCEWLEPARKLAMSRNKGNESETQATKQGKET